MIGTANNRAAAGSTNRTVMTSSARLVFVSETTSPIISMRGIRACCGAPSAREIAAVTAKTADHVLGRGRQEGRRPIARPEARGGADEQLDDTDGDHRAQEELGEIEGELDRPLTPVDHERQACPDQAGDDELPGREEEDPVDDRDLAHRERVGASADVEMDDLGFRHVEDGGQQPPGQRDRSPGRRPRRKLHRRNGERDRGEHPGQGPHARGARRR